MLGSGADALGFVHEQQQDLHVESEGLHICRGAGRGHIPRPVHTLEQGRHVSHTDRQGSVLRHLFAPVEKARRTATTSRRRRRTRRGQETTRGREQIVQVVRELGRKPERRQELNYSTSLTFSNTLILVSRIYTHAHGLLNINS